ncbi:MAG TPA: hypothetical protein VFQ37_09425 [Mycobacterium sp.]|nr:hypothetical protein [Mycobacterium sp.]
MFKGRESATGRAARRPALQSPPLKALGMMMLETSYHVGANAMLCLLAAGAGSADCPADLKAIRATIDKAGSLAGSGASSPAKGKVTVETGTSAGDDLATGACVAPAATGFQRGLSK